MFTLLHFDSRQEVLYLVAQRICAFPCILDHCVHDSCYVATRDREESVLICHLEVKGEFLLPQFMNVLQSYTKPLSKLDRRESNRACVRNFVSGN